jgi:hypothetical protein
VDLNSNCLAAGSRAAEATQHRNMSGRSVSRHEIEQLLERLSNIENECGTLKDKQSQFAQVPFNILCVLRLLRSFQLSGRVLQNLDDTNADLISLRNDVRQLQKFFTFFFIYLAEACIFTLSFCIQVC